MLEDTIKNLESRKKKTLIFFAVLAVLTASIFIGYFFKNSATTAAERSDLIYTGTIEAKNVMASFKVPGRIDSLFVEEGSKVTKGQKLAELENSELAAKLTQAKGAYQAAVSQAAQAEESIALTEKQISTTIAQLEAKVAQAEVGLKDAQQLYERMKVLHQSEAVSDSDFEKAENAYHAAESKLKEAQAALDQAVASKTKINIAQSQYQAALGQSEQAKGALEEAQTYLDNTVLKSPIAGYITQMYLEEGEMVNAGTPVFEITDLEHPYVKVFISEQKIGRVYLNQPVEVQVDAFPNKVFEGKVVWINNAGEFAVKKAVNDQHEHDLRSFEVKVDLPNPDLSLKVGMTATVKILEGAK